MDLANADLDILLSELDALRTSQNMSYQNVADACNVSQATVIRIFKRQTEPTMAMLQKIAVAVRYEPKREQIVLTGYTQEDYISFLQRSLEAEKEEQQIRLAQQEAHYNLLLNQKTRLNVLLGAVLFLFAAAFITWLIIDVTHPHIGWFQRAVSYFSSSGSVGNLFLSIRDWLRSLVA